MSPIPASKKPLPTIETGKEGVEKKNFAHEAREAYDKSPEKPKSIPEKVAAFVSEGGKKLFKEFEQGSMVKKIAILGGIVGAGVLAYQGIKKIGQMIIGGFKKLFGFGEDLEKGLESAKDGTIMNILKLALGGTLAVGTVSALYEAIKGKIGLGEITEAWTKDGVKGVGLLLLRKQKEGIISIGTDLWGTLAGALGLPGIDKVKEKLGDVKDEIEKGYKWLDDKCHFGEVKARMEAFFTDHNIQKPEWMEHLSLAEMAKDMGIDAGDENNYAKYAEYAVAGGAAILIYKWAKTHGLKKGIIINAGVYLGIVNETTGKFGRDIVKAMGNELDQAKKKLFEKYGKNSQIAAYLEDMFGDFSIEKHLESSLDWIKDHPAESMLAMNGMWLLRGIIVKGLKVGANAAWSATKFAANNPGKAALIGLGAAGLYLGRREFITDFINLTYDDPKGKEAIDMQTNLDGIFGVNRNEKEGLGEKQGHDFFKSLLEDPAKVLDLQSTAEAFHQGGFAILKDGLGKFYYLAKGANIPVQLAGLTETAFKSLSHIYSPDYDGNVVAATATVGFECLVFGGGAYMLGRENLKAISAIYDANGSMKLWHVLKSLVPGTKEWMFTVRSMLSVPLLPFMKVSLSKHIGTLEAKLGEITQELAKTPRNMQKIEEIADKLRTSGMFKDFKDVQKNLSGTRYSYETAKHFSNIENTVEQLLGEAKKGDLANPGVITNYIKNMTDKIGEYRSWGSRLVERWEMIKGGKISEALKLQTAKEAAELEKGAVAAKPLDQKATFKTGPDAYKTDVQLQDEAKKLREEIATLEEGSPLKKAKQKALKSLEVYLDATHAKGVFLKEADLAGLDETARAAKIEEAAANMEAAEKGLQARFEKSTNDIIQEAKRTGTALTDPSVQKKLATLDEQLIAPFAKEKKATLSLLLGEYKKLPSSLRSGAIKQQIKNVIEGADGTLMTKMVKGAKGRMKMMAIMAGAMFGTDALIHRNDPEREMMQIVSELGPDLGQLIVDCMPIIGTYSNFHSAISGKEMVSGKDVSGAWDRASNVAWGIVGLAGDAITALGAIPTGGTDIGVNIAGRLAKAAHGGSETAAKMIKMWPRFEKLAEKMGGWKNLATKMMEYVKGNKRVLATAHTVEKAGMVTGTVLLIGGASYHIFHKEVPGPELEVPAELTEEAPAPATTPAPTPVPTPVA